MLGILCVCGNGMGTSTLMKVNIRKICDQNNIDAEVESCAFSEAMAYLPNTDLVLTSPEWASLIPPSNAVMIETKNMVDYNTVKEALITAIKEHFPDEIHS